jgi:hypothetical protein
MTKVQLYLYDIVPVNAVFRYLGLGAYHTGVVVDGSVEYWFVAGDDGDRGGILTTYHPGRTGPELYKVIEMGTAPRSPAEVGQLVREWRRIPRWFGGSHHIIYHNCNTFSFEFCSTLLGTENVTSFPGWIWRFERLAQFIFSLSLAPTIYLFPWRIQALGTVRTTRRAAEASSESFSQIQEALLDGDELV